MVVTDGRVGPAASLNGPDYAIPETLGTISGRNLFHSFRTFSLNRGETATFTGPDYIGNVISRVTGGDISFIDGLLRSTVGQADFFFINPNGIVLGPNATVDVPAAFHASTADELAFDDGGRFSASSPEGSTLSQAVPEAFGFIGAKSASIEINGCRLDFSPEGSVSLSSGDITIQGTKDRDAAMVSLGGNICLRALGDSSGYLDIAGNDFDGAPPRHTGGTLLLNSAVIDTGGDGGGALSVHAGNVQINESIIKNDNTGDVAAGGDIEFDVDETLEIIRGSMIRSNTDAAGNSGDVIISTGDLKVSDAYIYTQTASASGGDGGDIHLAVEGLLEIRSGSQMTTQTFFNGDAGNIMIEAGELIVDGGENRWYTPIGSQAARGSEGQVGRVDIRVADSMSLKNGAQVSSATLSRGNAGLVKISVGGLLHIVSGSNILSSASADGDAGDIIVTADELMIDEEGNASFTGIASAAQSGSTGNSGRVEITVNGLIQLLNGAEITASTYSRGDAGDVIVQAGGITIDGLAGGGGFTGIASRTYSASQGNGGQVEMTVTGVLEIINGGQISSSTFSDIDAGDVIVNAGALYIDGGDLMSVVPTGISSQAAMGKGDAGLVEIRVGGAAQLLNGAQISSVTFSEGDGGVIDMTVGGRLQLVNAAQISGSTFSEGDGGKVVVTADALMVEGNGGFLYTGIGSTAEPDSQGNAGTVDIIVNGMAELLNGAQISSATFSKGNANDVMVTAGELLIDDCFSGALSGIASAASPDSQGNAGTIDITVKGLMQLLNGAKVSNSTFSSGNAGNLFVHASDLVLDSGYIQSAASFQAAGYAGDIVIHADAITLLNNSNISIAADQFLSTDTLDSRPQNSIVMNSGSLCLDQNSGVTARSTRNVPAGDINIRSNSVVIENNSGINTSSNDADGGDITIGMDSFILHDSRISTSVEGEAGDGGNIILGATSPESHGNYLVLKGGFIQANTAAEEASGGIIILNIDGVIFDKRQEMKIGETERQAFEPGLDHNIIQAAAPRGNPGEIPEKPAELDISSSIMNMSVQLAEPVKLSSDPCVALDAHHYSSTLVKGRREGIGGKSGEASSIVFDEQRLNRLLLPEY